MIAKATILGIVNSVHLKPDPYKKINVLVDDQIIEVLFYNEYKNKVFNMFKNDIVYIEGNIKSNIIEGVYIKKVGKNEQV